MQPVRSVGPFWVPPQPFGFPTFYPPHFQKGAKAFARCWGIAVQGLAFWGLFLLMTTLNLREVFGVHEVSKIRIGGKCPKHSLQIITADHD